MTHKMLHGYSQACYFVSGFDWSCFESRCSGSLLLWFTGEKAYVYGIARTPFDVDGPQTCILEIMAGNLIWCFGD